jgi:hypothetical protein
MTATRPPKAVSLTACGTSTRRSWNANSARGSGRDDLFTRPGHVITLIGHFGGSCFFSHGPACGFDLYKQTKISLAQPTTS